MASTAPHAPGSGADDTLREDEAEQVLGAQPDAEAAQAFFERHQAEKDAGDAGSWCEHQELAQVATLTEGVVVHTAVA